MSVTIDNTSESEGLPLVFNVTLSSVSAVPVILELVATSGSAAGGTDFETANFEYSTDGGATWVPGGGPSGREVTFAAGQTAMMVRVDTASDTIDEIDETMTLSVSSVVAGAPGDTSDTGTGTILDNDPPPSVSISSVSATEGNALVFDINLPNASSAPITLELTAGGGSAQAGVDFESGGFEVSTDGGATWVPAGGPDGRQVTFAPGEMSMKVRIETANDAVFEGDETMTLAVSSVIAGTVGPSNTGTGTILDNETPPDVTISDAQATEGQPLVFDVTLSGAAQAPITLELLASSASALAGTDFETTGFEVSSDGGTTWVSAGGATGREVTFAPGTTGLKVRIDTSDDAAFEGSETMTLSVSNVVAGTAGTTSDTGTGTIVDNDAAPVVSISDAQSTEGQPLVFDVSLSNASVAPITLELLASSVSATAGADFETTAFEVSTDGGTTWAPAGGATGREVTFAPGTTALKVRVDTADDAISEIAETMSLAVSSVVAGTVGSTADTGTGEILENDPPPTVTIGDAADVAEGQPLVFDVTLSGASSAPITLELLASSGTAQAGTDFETFGFEVSTDGGATWAPAGGAIGRDVTFAPGQTALKVRVDTTDDTLFEGGETMSLAVSNVIAGNVGNTSDTGAGAILDNDPVPTVSIGDAQATEGQPLTFDLTLSNGSTSTITLRLVANGGTANAGTDFETGAFEVSTDGGVTWVAAGGPDGRDVTFAPGQTALKVRVDTTDDPIFEGTEAMSLAIAGTVEGVVFGTGDTGAGTILDNDTPPNVTIGDAQATEGQPLVFDITLSNPSTETIRLELATADGSASSTGFGTDFRNADFEFSTDGGTTWVPAGSGDGRVVTFDPGMTALKVRITTFPDDLVEGTETMSLAVDHVVAGTVGDTTDTGTGTILDNPPPSVTIGNAQATEGQPLVFDVTLSHQSGSPITLELATSSGSAIGGLDFEATGFEVSTDGGATWSPAGGATGREVTFDAGATALKVRVDTTDDPFLEGTETMGLVVQSVVAGSIAGASPGAGTIFDNDGPDVTIGNADASEGQPLVFNVTLSSASATPITLELAATDGSATGGPDFETANFEYSNDGGTTWIPAGGVNGREVTFAAAQTALLVRVDTGEDTIFEGDETMTLAVSSVVASSVGDTSDTGTGTIHDNDNPPNVTIGDAQATEGQPLVFDVTLSNPSASAITLELATSNGSATGGSDFETTGFEVSTDGGATWNPAGGGNQVTFDAGTTALKVRVDTTDDALAEGTEMMGLVVQNVVAGAIGAASPGAGTIFDNDGPHVTIDNADASEGQPLVFSVTLSSASATPITLELAAGNGSATGGADFETANFEYSNDGGTTWIPGGGVNGREVTFAASQTALLVRVDTTEDTIFEGDETMTLSVSSVVASSVGDTSDTGTGTIHDNDGPPNVTIGDAQATEGQPLVFDITLSHASASAITLQLATSNGSAGIADFETGGFEVSTDGGTTWVPASGPTGRHVTFDPGVTALKIRIDTVDDALVEGTEMMGLVVEGASPPGSIGAASPGAGTIVDNDAPSVAIGNADASEGQPLVFEVTLSSASATPITLELAAANGTATGGSDFETANFEYSNDGGTTWIPGGGLNGREVTFAATQTALLVRVDTSEDTIFEGDETMTLSVSSVVAGTVGDTSDTGTGTIHDNDNPPNVTISAAQATEGQPLVFDVTLSNPSASSITLELATSNGSATGGSDFELSGFEVSTDGGTTWTPAGGGNQVTFDAGTTALKVRVDTTDDALVEGTEMMGLVVQSVVNGTIGAASPGAGTILDNDAAAAPNVTIDNADASEGQPLVFAVTLSSASAAAITLELSAADGSATGGADFETANFEYSNDGGTTWIPGGGLAGREVTFAAGQTALLVRIDTIEDTIFEGDETMTLSVSSVVAGTVGDTSDTGTGTIHDNDGPPNVTIGNAQATEGQPLIFDVTLSHASASTIRLLLDTSDGSATGNADFETTEFEFSTDGGTSWAPASGALGTEVTFDPGVTALKVRIETTDDALVEGTEMMGLVVQSVVLGTIGAASPGAGTILDNEVPNVTIGNADASEGQPLVFTVTLSSASITPITLDLAAANGSATGGADFETTNFEYSNDGGTTWIPGSGLDGRFVIFAPGQTELLVRVDTGEDTIFEGDETMTLSVSSVVAGTVGDTSDTGTGTIHDNDGPPNVAISAAQATEGQPLVFDVTLSNPSASAITLQLATSNGSAIGGADFETTGFEVSTDGGATWTSASGGNQVTFDAGATALKVRVDTTDDAIAEGTEMMGLVVQSVVNGTIGAASPGAGTILDSDAPPSVTIGDAQATEGQPLVFDVTLSNPSANPITLQLSALTGSAAGGADFETSSFEVSTNGGATWVPAGGVDGREVTFAAGATALKVRIDTTDDALAESTETMSLAVASVVAGTVGDTTDTGTGTILDNDAAPPPSVTIGNALTGESQPLVFTVTLSNASIAPITLELAAANGSATGGADFETTNFEFSNDGGTTWIPGSGLSGREVTFAPGQTELLVRVDTAEDAIFEGDETMTLSVSSVVAGTVGDTSDTGTGTILDNDAPPNVTIGDAQAAEGQPLVFDVTLSHASTSAITLRLATANGSATGGADFETSGFEVSTDGGTTWVPAGLNNEVTFDPGATALKVRIDTTDDALPEGNEMMGLLVAQVVAGTVGGASDTGAGTILASDGGLSWRITGSATTPETGGLPNYTVSYSSDPITAPVTIQLDPIFPGGYGGANPEGSGGANPSDYLGTFAAAVTAAVAALPLGSGISFNSSTFELTFSPGGANSFTFTLPIGPDIDPEPTESYLIKIQNPSVGTIDSGFDAAVTAIIDDDGPGLLSLWSITGDYAAVEGQAPKFTVLLSGPEPATGNTVSVTLLPEFTAGLNFASAADFTNAFAADVQAAIAALPPGHGVSYDNGTGVLTFTGGGVTRLEFGLPTISDGAFEGDEVYLVNLSNASIGSAISPSAESVFSIVVDQDAFPNDVQWLIAGTELVDEGGSASYTVKWKGETSGSLSVELGFQLPGGVTGAVADDFAVAFDTAVASAIAALPPGPPITYDAATNRLTFDALAPQQFMFTLPTLDDAIAESIESYAVTITNPSEGRIIETLGGIATRITDNENPPDVSIGDGFATEGQPLIFDMGLSNPSSTPITLELAAQSGTALGGVDFEITNFEYSTDGGLTWIPGGGASGREVTFPAGQSGLVVRIDTIDDPLAEGAETMTLNVSSVVSGSIGSVARTGTGTISDNDAPPTVTIGDAQATEGQPLVFDVTLSNPSAEPITLRLATANGTATGGPDFEMSGFEVSTDGGVTWTPAGLNNDVTFAPGATALKVRIDTTDDTLAEGTEMMGLVVAQVVTGTVGNASDTGAGTILDGDAAPSVAIADAQATEGQPLVFAVTLSNPSAEAITLQLSAQTGTALIGQDFEAVGFEVSTDGGATWVPAGGVDGREVTFAPGQTLRLVRVDTTDDLISEGTETMSLAVSSVVAGTVSDSSDTGTGTILDNDGAPNVTIGDAQTTEGQPLVFNVALSNASATPITLELAAGNGSATGGTDFETANFEYSTDGGTTWVPGGGLTGREATFAPGQTSLMVRVDTAEDTIFEGDETMSLSVSAVVAGTVGDTSDTGTGTIQDNETAPNVTIGDAQATEGQPLVFDVTLSNAGAAPITLDLAAANGTAQGGSDFEISGFEVSTDGGATWTPAGGPNGTQVTFAAGATALKVRVDTTDDALDENSETMTLGVASVVAGTVGSTTDTGTGTIADNDEGVCRLLINEVGLGVATAPSGEKCLSYVEIWNAGGGACSAKDLACHRLEIQGPCGDKSVVKFGSFHPAVSVPAGAFLVVYENGEYKTVDANGTLITTGTWDGDCDGWELGSSVAEEIGVNLFVKGGDSVDAFFANGMDRCDFRKHPLFEGVDAPHGMAKLAHLAGVERALFKNGDFNGLLGDIEAARDALGLSRKVERWLGDGGEPLQVFARVFGNADGTPIDTDTAADWTVAGLPTDGRLNSEPGDTNPGDAADDLDPRQNAGTNAANAGQTVLLASLAGANIEGGRGPDFLYGDDRDNVIAAGDHNDLVAGGRGNDHLRGGAGADVLIDIAGRDVMVGDSGDDTLIAAQRDGHWRGNPSPGADVLIGDGVATAGDTGLAGGTDVILAGDLDDIIFGDTLLLDAASRAAFDAGLGAEQAAALISLTLAAGGDPALHTNGAGDWIEAGGGNDVVFGQGGDDRINAGAGDDIVDGGAGNDDIRGQDGNDVLIGGPGADSVNGGAGDDLIFADPRDDIVLGGGGKDTLALTMDGVLDLGGLAGNSIRSIEQVDLRGGGDLQLSLSVDDVQAMSSNGRLTVLGDGGDQLTFDATGHSVETRTDGGFTVYVIDHGDAVLRVDANLTHNVVGI